MEKYTYKAISKDMYCRGYNYELGGEYQEKYVHIDPRGYESCGFHACSYPLETLNQYDICDSDIYEVLQSGKIEKSKYDSTIASTKLKICRKLTINEVIQKSLQYIMKGTKAQVQAQPIKDEERIDNLEVSNIEDYEAAVNPGNCGVSHNAGCHGAATNVGDYGAAINIGKHGAATNIGLCGVASNEGDYGMASNVGDAGAAINKGFCGAASNTGGFGITSNRGNYGVATNVGSAGVVDNSGYSGVATNTGNNGVATNTGTGGVAINTGHEGIAIAEHPSSVAVAWGPESKAKGVKGAHLVFAEWKTNGGESWEMDTWTFVGSKTVQVDGTIIKENTYYRLKAGKVEEAEE